MLILVTGGARSGKSTFAERYAARLGSTGDYIATSQIYDDEMKHRMDLHRERREESGFPWRTWEEPYDLAELLSKLAPGNEADNDQETQSADNKVVMVDCLTLWLSNWLLKLEDQAEQVLPKRIEELAAVLTRCRNPVILVTNEVGDGIVPEYRLGRQFRDYAGLLNQRVAAVCDQVFLVTAGIPVDLKKLAFSFDNVGRADIGSDD